MKAEELMIGDWVSYRGTNIKVTSLYNKGDSNEVGWSDKESVWVNGRCIEPIPLTPEILEKNGFRVVFEGELHVCYFQDTGRFLVDIKVDKVGIFQKLSIWDGFGNKVTIIECRFVHQLQHAFWLCGINKEIVL